MVSFGFTVPRADRAHGYLWLRLQNCGDPTVEGDGRELNTLRGTRNWADYDLGRPFPQATARTRVQAAYQVIQILDSIVDPTRIRIINAMKLYEQNVLRDVTWHP
jgi:hypothetical protein